MLKSMVEELMSQYYVVGLKLGTETEDCSFEEIIWIQNNIPSYCPLTLKIGGVEARNDMRFALSHQIHKVLAPMVETPYSLSNFVSTILELEKEMGISVQKAINIESITAFHSLETMLEQDHFQYIDSVTIGRGDLSSSMGLKPVTHPQVNEVVTQCVHLIHQKKKPVSIGGSITQESIVFFKSLNIPIFFNTRNVVIKMELNAKSSQILQVIQKALQFEMELNVCLSKVFPESGNKYQKRLEILKGRL